MKSETITIQNIFQDRRQYCVPFYQRDAWYAVRTGVVRTQGTHLQRAREAPASLDPIAKGARIIKVEPYVRLGGLVWSEDARRTPLQIRRYDERALPDAWRQINRQTDHSRQVQEIDDRA